MQTYCLILTTYLNQNKTIMSTLNQGISDMISFIVRAKFLDFLWVLCGVLSDSGCSDDLFLYE